MARSTPITTKPVRAIKNAANGSVVRILNAIHWHTPLHGARHIGLGRVNQMLGTFTRPQLERVLRNLQQ